MDVNESLPRDPRTAKRSVCELLARVDALRILDERSDDEILGYGEGGLPG